MEIEFYKKNVYGNEMLYVKDAKIAGIIKELTGKKTITEADIKYFGFLGLKFNQVMQ